MAEWPRPPELKVPMTATVLYRRTSFTTMPNAASYPHLQVLDADQIQPASLDLRLGEVAYRVRASFLPGPDKTVDDRLDRSVAASH